MAMVEKKSLSHKIFQVFNIILMVLIAFICFIPIWHVLMASVSDPGLVDRSNGLILFPLGSFSLNGYRYVLSYKNVWIGYRNTLLYVVAQCLITGVLTVIAGYILSRKRFRFRKILMGLITFTMLFNGGLVPTYILMSQTLHLKNTYAAMIIPLLVNVWYLIMLKTFMADIPNEIIESARIDGAGHGMIYLRFVLPLSKPALATIGLLTLLDYWNSWQPAMLYIDEKEMYPLQYMLQVMLRNIMEILKQMQNNISIGGAQNLPSESARMAMCLLAVGPMLFIFPFFQKYFTRGLTVGAVKG